MAEELRKTRIRAALAIVTDLTRYDTTPDLGETELGRVISANELSDADLVFGLAQIALILLVKLNQVGQSTDKVLQDIGLRNGA